MMRSLFSGVAGLRTHQTRMDVIGNNIANVNTTAFKSQSMVFTDLLYQTTQSASGANAATGKGGTNARQIGLGATTGAISTAVATQGSAQTTNNPFDIMISGDNFFVVNNGSENFFTRDGSFTVDGAGNLVTTTTGYMVMGWQSDENGNIIRSQVSPLKIMSEANMTYEPEATTKAQVTGIVDKNDTNVNSDEGLQISIPLYDNLGYKYNAIFSVHAEDGDSGEYFIKLEKLLDTEGKNVTESSGITFGCGKDAANEMSVNMIRTTTSFKTGATYKKENVDGEYKLYDTSKDPAEEITNYDSNTLLTIFDVPEGASNLTFDKSTGVCSYTISTKVQQAARIKYDPSTGIFKGIGTGEADTLTGETSNITFTGGSNSGAFSTISVDFSTTTMWDNNGISTMSGINGDDNNLGAGRKIGEMSGISISSAGLITAAYDNGQTRVLGQIATAAFANPSGLEKVGDNLYSATMNSGDFDGIGVDITANGGKMTSGVLEMSNVDLSNEFTTMITTQRGFQANSRIITVSDTMLEELVNLKR